MHKATFHQGLHCFQGQRTEIHHFIEILTSNPIKLVVDNSILIVLIYTGYIIVFLTLDNRKVSNKHLQDQHNDMIGDTFKEDREQGSYGNGKQNSRTIPKLF